MENIKLTIIMTNRSLRAKRRNLGYTLSSQNATSRALRLAGRHARKEDEEELTNERKQGSHRKQEQCQQ